MGSSIRPDPGGDVSQRGASVSGQTGAEERENPRPPRLANSGLAGLLSVLVSRFSAFKRLKIPLKDFEQQAPGCAER